MLRLNTRYFYSKLNKYEKRLYRQIAKSLLKESYVINHDLTWDKANMIEVFSAVIDDFPELFYVQNSYIDWGVPFVLKVRGIQFYKHEEIVKIRKELDKIYHKYSIDVGEDERWLKILDSLEYLDTAHKELFLRYSSARRPESGTTDEYQKRFLAYFIYRHCTEAFSGEDFCTRLSFCLFCERLFASLICAQGAQSLQEVATLACILSEEIEYSEENTWALME